MDLSSTGLSYLADASVRSICLALIAAAVLAAARIKSVSVRHGLWTVVAAAMLLLPMMSPLLPPLPVRVLSAPTVEPGIALGPIPAVTPAATPVEPVREAWRPSWQQVVLGVYLAGVFLFLLRLLFGYLFTLRLVRASRRVHRPWPTAFAGAVYESDWISVPITIGCVRSKILLPSVWRQWDEAKLHAVLAHELTHVRRGDWAISVLAGVNRCVFWFHPLAWWVERRLASLAEQACDDEALLLLGDRDQYAQTLLDMAAAVRPGQGRLTWEAMAMANAAEVRTRIERILDETRQIPRGLSRSRWMAMLACTLPVFYVASAVQLAPAQVAGQWAPYPDSLVTGNGLTAADAEKLERDLLINPQDLAARGKLIAYYFLNAVREPRLRHIFWLIEHHPESEVTGLNSAGISPEGGLLNSQADYLHAKSLWTRQIQQRGSDARVLGNAAQFFAAGGELHEAERLLKQARALEPREQKWSYRQALLYAQAIAAAHRSGSETAFSVRIKAELENSTDAPLLMNVGNLLTSIARSLAEDPRFNQNSAATAEIASSGERFLQRARQLSGRRKLEQQVRPPAAPVEPPVQSAPRLQVDSETQAPKLISRVEPSYPPLAAQARIQGVVRMAILVGRDGRVANIQLIGGHPLFVPATIAAVRQWVYQPTYQNGEPVEVSTKVDVPFMLPRSGTPLANGQPPGPVRIRVGANVQAAKLVRKVEPVYPAVARQARIEGVVRLTATIAPDGRVRHLQVLDGHPLLAAAAQDAVRQWTYQQTSISGQAVEVMTQIDIPFVLPENP